MEVLMKLPIICFVSFVIKMQKIQKVILGQKNNLSNLKKKLETIIIIVLIVQHMLIKNMINITTLHQIFLLNKISSKKNLNLLRKPN